MTFSLFSCAQKEIKEYIEQIKVKSIYFENLIKIKQDQQNIKANNSFIFDQFREKLFESKENNFNFLNEKKLIIKTIDDFDEKIFSKINELYDKFNINNRLTKEQITKMFEQDFLNGNKLENELTQNNLILLENESLWYTNDFLNFIIDENTVDKFNILEISVLNLPGIDSGETTRKTSLVSQKKRFTLIKTDKNKEIIFSKTNEEENKKILLNLYKEFQYKEIFFIKNDLFKDYWPLIFQKQKEQNIFILDVLIFKNNSLNSNNLLLNDDIHIINNKEEFKNKIIPSIKEFYTEENSKTKKSENDILTEFEKIFFKDKTFDQIFENNSIVIHRTLEYKTNYNCLKQSVLIKSKIDEENKVIDFSLINDSDFNYNLNESYNLSNSKIQYNFSIVPKKYKINIVKSLSFKTINELLKNN
ncbi:hypothetical protein [Mycoplasma sp. 5370]